MNLFRTPSALRPLVHPTRQHLISSYAIHTRIKPVKQPVLTSLACLSTSTQSQQTGPKRYGTAKEPPPHLRDSEAEEKEEAENEIAASSQPESSPEPKTKEPEQKEVEASEPEEENHIEVQRPIVLPSHDDCVRAEISTLDSELNSDSSKHSTSPSLDRVLDLTSPSSQREEDKPPHLQAPRYVHHFDTWTLVRDLQNGGFKVNQSTAMMKGVRGLLAENIELARRALVSKSNVENETYLFKAACSELKTEIQNGRKSEADRWRSQRAQLQHEVDVISQKMTQEMATLKDELNGLFDDRKMAVRMEQKGIEAKIQDINYKITRVLGSDARVLVESIRWSIIRQVSLAAFFIVVAWVAAFAWTKQAAAKGEAEQKARHNELLVAHDVERIVNKGAKQGLSEEALLAVDGVGGG